MNRWLLALFAITMTANAQPPAAHFDVATIKPSNPDALAKDMRLSFRNGQFEAINITLKEILSAMSGFSTSTKVQGGPNWTETDRYDIMAKTEREIPANDRNAAVMSLLEDRFKLAAHRDAQEASGLALTVGRKQPALQRSSDGETTQITGDRRHLVFQAVSMERLVNYLSQIWRTTVKNDTGIAGTFDFSVDPDGFATDPSDKFADLLRSAIGDLGFVLQSRKVMLDITVIDHAERPTEN